MTNGNHDLATNKERFRDILMVNMRNLIFTKSSSDF